MAEAFLLQQGHTREKLMEEALHIQRIIPERHIDEIYSSLETFFDDPKRVQRVVLKFLDHVKEENETAGSTTEELSQRPRKRNLGDEHNKPSTSGIPRKKPSKISVNSDANGNKTEISVNSDRPPIIVSAHSDYKPAESDKDIVRDRIDEVLDQFNLSNRSDSDSDVVSEGDKFNDIKEYLWEKEGFAFSSEEEEDFPESFSEPVKNVNGKREEVIVEASTSFWEPVVPRLAGIGEDKNIDERNHPVDLTLPGPSTANYDLAASSPQLDDSDVVCIDLNAVDDEKKQAYYNSLIEIFPDAQKDFVKAICDKCSQDANWLSDTISGLLENGYPKAAASSELEQEANKKLSERTEEEKKKIIEENYNNLLAIFPNADPTYIREICEQIADDEEAMKKFVSDTLESGKYPTLAEYEERMKVMEIREKYLKNFKIEEFLEIFPDPFKYFFEEKKSDKSTSELSLNYLKSRYRKIRVSLLQDCLIKNKYSLSKSCANLDKCRTFMKSKRGEHEIQYCEKDTKNIPFMQEVAFIENKEKIKTYLKEKESRRVEAFKKAKENNELLECGCCYDDEVLAEDTVTCGEGHTFCKTCLQKYAETQIGDGKTVFTCLTSCDAEFSLKTLQGVLKPSVFSKMLQRKQIEEVKSAGIPGLEACPFCDFASIPPEEDKIFRCLNPECMKESCRNCKELSHIPLRCEEVEKPEEVKIRTYIEDRMTQALIRTCWRCEKKFIKIDGCNKMTCTCGALMCYICRKPVKDYTHFNGEGGTEYHKCPLFSKNDDLHVKAVEEEATKARNEALAKNPNIQLKHDPTHILPERTHPDVPEQRNVQFNLQYNGRLVPPVHLNFHMPAGAAAVHRNLPPLPGGMGDLNWLNPIIAVGQPHFMVAQGPPIVMAGPRDGVRPVPAGHNNRPEAQGLEGQPAEQGQLYRVAMAQAHQVAVIERQPANAQAAREVAAAAARRQRAREAAAFLDRRQARAAADARYQARGAAVQNRPNRLALVAAELMIQRVRARPAAQGQQAGPAAAQGQQAGPAAAAARVQQAGPAAAAQVQQAGPAAAAQVQQAGPAAARGQQVRGVGRCHRATKEAIEKQLSAEAQHIEARPAAQGPQAGPAVAAERQQAGPAAADRQQAGPVVLDQQPVRRTVVARISSPVPMLREMIGFQPIAQREDPPAVRPPLAADNFVAQWLARIPPQLDIPVAQDHQRPQEPLSP